MVSFNGNVGFNKNKVKNLGTLSQYPASSGWASTQIQDDFIVKPGHSVGEIYGYVTAGRYEVSDFEDYYASGEKWVLKQDVASNAGVIGASYLRPGALKLKNIDDSDNVIDEKKTVPLSVIPILKPVVVSPFQVAYMVLI